MVLVTQSSKMCHGHHKIYLAHFFIFFFIRIVCFVYIESVSLVACQLTKRCSFLRPLGGSLPGSDCGGHFRKRSLLWGVMCAAKCSKPLGIEPEVEGLPDPRANNDWYPINYVTYHRDEVPITWWRNGYPPSSDRARPPSTSEKKWPREEK